MMQQLILLGAPGSGKGTQAKKLVETLSYIHLSTGDLLRAEIAKKSDLGKRVTDIMNAGQLVDDSTVLELLKANCNLSSNRYIFDGFPRNIDQAIALDEMVLGDCDRLVLYFDLDLNVLLSRIVNRRSCTGCGEIYNLVTKAPKIEGKCDLCGKQLEHRKDDSQEIVLERLEIYKTTIGPVLEYYEAQGKLVKLDASKSSVDIFNGLKQALEK